MQLTLAQLEACLGNIIAATKAFDPATTFIGLFTGINDAGLNTTMADLTLAPGTLATAVEVTTWSAQYALQNGCQVVDGPLVKFTPASAADACQVQGWYFASAATGGTLLGYGYLNSPVLLTYPNDALSIVPRLCLDPAGQWSAEVVIDG